MPFINYTPPNSSTLKTLFFFNMSSQSLNPFAPEFIPKPHPPYFIPPPPPAAAHHPLPPPPPPYSSLQPSFFQSSTQTFTYIQPPFLPTNYYVPPQNPIAPPQAKAAIAGDGRRGVNLGIERRRKKSDRRNVEVSMQEEGRRHKVMHLKRDEENTTIMIKNIPYDCPRKELISLLDSFCLRENQKPRDEGTSREAADGNLTSAYDFLYLPIDFRSRKSRGFAFVNFTNSRAVWKFFDAFHLKNWHFGSSVERNKWTKKIEICCAKIQGQEALVNHFSQSIFQCETDEYLPVSFNPPRDGSGQPLQLTVIGNRRALSHRRAT